MPFIVRVETGYQDRDQYKIAVLYDPGKPWTPWSAAGRLEPQAADHPRRELRDRPPGRRRRPDVDERRRRCSARLRRDVDRAQQRRPQLQPRDPGRVDGDGQGAPRRAVRRDPLHDRHRLLGRLAHPAAGRQRLPRHLPGHPAGVQLPRRLVDRASSSSTTTSSAATSRTRPSGATGVAWTPDAIAAVEGHPNHVNSIVVRHGLLDLAGRAGRRLPGRRRPSRTTTPRRIPGGVRCTLADYMINVFGPRPASVWSAAEQAARPRLRRPAARQRRRPVRARGAQEGHRSRPSSSSTSTPRSAARTIDISPDARAHRRRPAGAARTPTAAARSTGQQPRQGRDHRPARARPGRVPRRLPLVGDPRPARARARHLRQPGDLVRGRSR